MPSLQMRAGPQTPKDNTWPEVRGGPWGEMAVGDMSGFFAEQVARGNGYCWASAVGGVVPIVATTTNNKMVLYNPPTSRKVVLLQCVKYGRTAVGTPLEGSIVYNRAQLIQSASTAAGTGNDIVSYTKASATNLRSDKVGDDSGMFFAPAASVLTVAPSLWVESGIAQTADAGASTTGGPQCQYLVDWMWGLLQLWPGTLMSVGSSTAIATTYTIGIYGLVLPQPDFA